MADHFYWVIFPPSDKSQPVLYVIQCFWEIWRRQSFQNCKKIRSRTSHRDVLGTFWGISDHFNCVILPPVTKISLHCLWFMVFGRLSDVNLIKTVTKYVVGRLIGASSELFKEWAIAILRDIAPQWQKSACMVYDSMFWGDLGMSIWLKLSQNM